MPVEELLSGDPCEAWFREENLSPTWTVPGVLKLLKQGHYHTV